MQTPDGFGLKDVIMELYGNNGNSLDGVIDKYLPKEYAPLVKSVKNLPWPQFVDLTSSMLKEYGKGKTTEQVLLGLLGQKAREKGESFRDSLGQRIRETFHR